MKLNNLNFNKNKEKGFTLIELMVSVSLFTFIAVISIGSVLTIFDANRRSQASKTVVDNLNFAIESMTRTVRFGENYHSCSESNLSTPQNCSTGDDILAVLFNGDTVVYKFCDSSKSIRKSDNGDVDCEDMEQITSPDTVIEHLRFYVFGTTDNPSLQQPYVVVVIKGYVGNKPTLQSNFLIETMMSQRKLDI